MTIASKRWVYAAWLVLICGFAALHALHLRADFPNHSPWLNDWAKYTDEGWYGNAAIRAHLFGNWYLPGDFNPAPAVPVWPFIEWVLFFFTGVTIEAARGLAIAFFFANLALTYLLLRTRGPRWMPLLALTLLVTSPFLYCFSRLAILEPMLTAFTLAALNLAVRLPRFRRPVLVSVPIGLLFTLMLLTKTTAVFLLPALGWAMLLPLWQNRRLAVRCALAAAGASAFTFALWMALIVRLGLLPDYKYLFFVNNYPKPAQFYWPLLSLWWSFHGGLWVDHILIPLSGLLVLGAALAWRGAWGRGLLLDPVFGASVLAVAGYVLFMTYQDHPQPRYFALTAFFCIFLVAQGAAALLGTAGLPRQLGWAVVALAIAAAVTNSVWTLSYAANPEYTFVDAATQLTRYIDQHPNGKRLLVSISGDQITLVTHLPTLCDDFGTPSATYPDLEAKLARYQPGWYATWNDLDPGTLADIHTHFSLEQVASFRAFDDPDRNVLVLFKLHPLPAGMARNEDVENLQIALPGDKIAIPIE
ncbi:MAG: glycosyltransferase family 39 protein [Acidobacteriota bacterium]|nr:glycosyltransferase family 39 protein [Acidobacteriota bacterium]